MIKKWLKKLDNNSVDCDQENQQTWGMIRSCICDLEFEGQRTPFLVYGLWMLMDVNGY